MNRIARQDMMTHGRPRGTTLGRNRLWALALALWAATPQSLAAQVLLAAPGLSVDTGSHPSCVAIGDLSGDRRPTQAPADSTPPAGAARPPTAPAGATYFQIVPGKPNLARFESRAPLETFEGKTPEVSGRVKVDPAAIGDFMEVSVEVDLASLDTGIDLRNQHMREHHLETAKYPKATFRGGKVHKLSRPSLEADATVTFELEGIMDLHGVQKPLRVPVEMTYAVAGGVPQLQIVTHFDVKLADFDIKRPKFLVMQLDEVQHVSLELVASATKAAS